MLESILFILNMIIVEYNQQTLLDSNYVANFISSIQERVEFIYSQFHVLEQIDFKDPKAISISTGKLKW